ncbi:8367_t:CDS:2 [Dentiscutata erythropus]|uniref:8367_t:CDS:1 n=1 Tax=Dentiscutata erythropus TaxID=1348616 RepID=A0A9N9GTB3_9GLOM|nr:8367_t:CDS:2 [Dentiscutata erythropus]
MQVLNHKKPYAQKSQKTALLQANIQNCSKDKSENEFKENINNVLQQNANVLLMKNINEDISKQKNKQSNSPKLVDQANFVYTKLSSYNVKNRSLKKRRILADLEIKRLLNKLGSINPSLAKNGANSFISLTIALKLFNRV